MLSANELRQATETAARADLDRAAAKLTSIAPSLRIEHLVETGDPSQRISEVAARCKARGIVLSSQGVSATGPGGFGTVVGRVVSMTPVPVMVVRPNGVAPDPDLVARFVIAHDGSEHAARALPLAQDLARRLSAHIHIITVVEDEESPLSGSVAATIDPHVREEAQGRCAQPRPAAGRGRRRPAHAARTSRLMAGPGGTGRPGHHRGLRRS